MRFRHQQNDNKHVLVWVFLMIFVAVAKCQSLIDSFEHKYEIDIFDQEEGYGGTNQLKNLLGDAEELQEWEPVRNNIGPGDTQYYQFVVNTSNPGLSEYVNIIIFLSGNICAKPPASLETDKLKVYYTFNDSGINDLETIPEANTVEFDDGYLEMVITNPTSNPYTNLYIAVKSPNSSYITGVWTYELGVSQNGLMFQWDDRTWVTIVDKDDDSALFVTGNLTAESTNLSNVDISSLVSFNLFVYPYDQRNYFNGLEKSWCAIKNGPALLNASNMEYSYTDRGIGVKQQMLVQNLNSSTKYVGYATQNFENSKGSTTKYGGVIFSQYNFETMESDSCELIFNLSFCEDVAYSVPKNNDFSTKELVTLYDNYTQDLYSNFSKALQIIPCDAERDSIYTVLRNCDDCAHSYKSWLCATAIPRCTTKNETGYILRDVGGSRNNFINDEIKPNKSYYEILPCIDLCYSLVQDCPADFNFQCPTDSASQSKSYYWTTDDDSYISCNSMQDTSTTSGSISLFKRLKSLNRIWLLICLSFVFLFI